MDEQRVFQALADPVRRRLIERLATAPQPVHLLAAREPISRPAISRHLRVLREAGLVQEHRQGREHHYRLDPEQLADVQRWLDRISRYWGERFALLQRLAEEDEDNG